MKKINLYLFGILSSLFVLVSCSDENNGNNGAPNKELSEEYYSGGILGTAFIETPFAYEQPTPAVEQSADFSLRFKYGEAFFEDQFRTTDKGWAETTA